MAVVAPATEQKIAREARVLAIQEALVHYKDHEVQAMAEFAHAEDAAHNVAYYLAENWQAGESVELVDSDGAIREYDVTPIETVNPAIVGFILAGKSKENNRIHVVFRGTADGASAVRDTEYAGAGQESFHAEQDLILSQIIRVVGERVSNTDRNQKVSFSGHSLGAADAGNCASAFLEAMSRTHAHKRYQEKSSIGKAAEDVKNALTLRPSAALTCSSYAPLVMVDEVVINKVNGAGVPHHSHKRSMEHAKRLAKWGVKLKVRALMVAGDGVQLSGQTAILHDAPADVADVQVLKVASGHEGWLKPRMVMTAAALSSVAATAGAAAVGTLSLAALYGTKATHTKHNFVTPMRPGEYQHFTNATPEGAKMVQRKLSNKTMLFDNNPLSHLVKKVTHTVTSPFVRSRKVSPNTLAQYEMFKTDHDLLYNAKLFDELCDAENSQDFSKAARVILDSPRPA